MKILSGGELVVECLARNGVRQVFSIVGGQMGTLYDAIGNSSEIDIFVPRNETVVPIMAAGYCAASGIPAVSMTTVGAGVVYEVAGLLKAWLDYLPVISIAPQVQSYKTKPHQESLQACNQDELFFPITKWNAIIYHWQRIPQLIDRAFREAQSGIPGPVHLDIPVDVLFKRQWLSDRAHAQLLPEASKTRYAGQIVGDAAQLRRASAALAKAERPVVVVGQGVGRFGRHDEIRTQLEALGMPVLNTLCSTGPLNGQSPYYVGNVALFSGPAAGLDALATADCLLVVGIDRYTKALLEGLSTRGATPVVVQVEADSDALLVESERCLPVYADPRSALAAFARAPRDAARDLTFWRAALRAAATRCAEELTAGLDPSAIAAAAAAMLPDAIVVADGQRACTVALASLRSTQCAQLFIMDDRDIHGAGLPFAIGAALAHPRKEVVLLCDKDSLFHHIRELQPVAFLGLPLTIVCYDDEDHEHNVANLPAVLESLGCTTQLADGAAEQQLWPRAGRGPRAYVVRTNSPSALRARDSRSA